MGRVIWDEFFENHDWPMAASLAVVLLALAAAALCATAALRGLRRWHDRRGPA